MVDVRVQGPDVEWQEEILTPQALGFVADLQTRLGALLVALDTAETVDDDLVGRGTDEEVLFEQVAPADEFADFLTLPAEGRVVR